MRSQCCFCGNEIVERPPDPVRLSVSGEPPAEQELYCHKRCLRRALDPSVPLILES
jgi:hypothetical protein